MSVLAAALAGFLLHDLHPARVALGICGSMSAGSVIALGSVYARAEVGIAESAGVLFAMTALVGADAVLVLGVRRLGGRGVFRGGPDHLAHRLRRLGMTAPRVSLLLDACQARAYRGCALPSGFHRSAPGGQPVRPGHESPRAVEGLDVAVPLPKLVGDPLEDTVVVRQSRPRPDL